MPAPCLCCAHPARAEIDRLLEERRGRKGRFSQLVSVYALSESALRRHACAHLERHSRAARPGFTVDRDPSTEAVVASPPVAEAVAAPLPPELRPMIAWTVQQWFVFEQQLEQKAFEADPKGWSLETVRAELRALWNRVRPFVEDKATRSVVTSLFTA